MSVVIKPDRLRYELTVRGLTGMDLARASGLSAATISAALAGRGVSMQTLRLIARTLTTLPKVAILDSLVFGFNVASSSIEVNTHDIG
jgi:transcriptional regulator with XRE-family HTH domain